MSTVATPDLLPEVAVAPGRPSPRIDVIQDLRGLAALSVCWYHLAYHNTIFMAGLPKGILRNSAQYGRYGVQIFFVISGFILPYSLFRAGYQTSGKNFGLFLWKRLSRLEPPYLVSIVLMLGVMSLPHLLPWWGGTAPTFSLAQILLHLGYLNSLFNQGGYLNPVYWTLGVEVQYYVLIGLLYPLIASDRRSLRVLAWAGLVGLAVSNHAGMFGHWLFSFMLGFAVFQYRAGIIGGSEFAITLLLTVAGCLAIIGKSVPVLGPAACAVILFVRHSTCLTSALGDMSYSLYLIHLPIGGLVFRLAQLWGDSTGSWLLTVLAAMAVSLAAAYLMYRWIEKPCQRYAASLRFRKS